MISSYAKPLMITDKNPVMRATIARSITKKSIAKKSLLIFCLVALLASCSSNKKQKDQQDLARQQVEELYSKGKKALDKGNYSFALEYYRALESNYPFGELTEQAKLDMIFALHKSNQADRAVDAAENFISLYPTHQNVDYAYYMKGVANFEKKQGRLDKFIKGGQRSIRDPKPYRDSNDAFDELIKRYPNSVYAEDAKQRNVYIRNTLAARELAIGQFYFDNETYVATLNRCKNIIYKYETSPSVEGALVLMEQTYLEMGMEDLAASTHSVLIENFPNYQKEPFKAKKKGVFSRINPFKRKQKKL